MILLLMRHGIAVEREDFDGDDAARPLTEKGKERVRDICGMVRKLDLTPTHYLHSPRVRSIQTAEHARKVFGGKKSATHQIDSLDFEGTWPALVKDIQAIVGDESKGACVLAVGHEPNLGQFITEALIKSHSGFHIRKGAIAALSWPDGISIDGANFRFYLTYSMVKKL